ncbi:kinase-like domain-containing protein [Suillus fuscotomentosus]|uniref:Kinase-like domain-containing protein n=1 Tax=Suillus fuscotomentosus TaxID=1912939 RepID=A0AAD4EHK1_9AGAM|nr:kinase-like domain-containing protein [Suillus fuscotomentosus]KAG1906275.1 kinase-like domain-containing protein [Suillus fuscotomentosus]
MDSSVENNGVLAFNTIPATAVQKVNRIAYSSGELGDVSKYSKSTHVAVKVINLKIPGPANGKLVQSFVRRIRRKLNVWIQLSHDNILPLEDVTERFGPLPALVTPWMENGSLNDYLRREVNISREKKLTMVREVAAGLQYLHDKDIVHGNLTGTNVLVGSDGTLYLGDFWLSMISTESENVIFGCCNGESIRWMPPRTTMPLDVSEVMEDMPTKARDIYSYGCILMQVFSGHQPYHDIKAAALIQAILTGTKPFSQLTDFHKIQQYAQRCLSTNSEDRPVIAHIVEFLWEQTNIAETMETMLPKTVTKIPKADLVKCDRHADDVDVLGAALKCKWVHKIEVTVKTLMDDIHNQNDLNKMCNRIRRELSVREKLKRDTILALYGMTTGFGVLPSFVYPWMAGGSLHDYLKRENSDLTARRKLDILVQIADGIKHLHMQDIAHGNLTGDVIFLDVSGRVRIAEFSHSVILAEANSRIFSEQLLGDARYISPERIVSGGQTGARKPTKPGDVYSYGCIAILVLLGKVPYWWIQEESQVLFEKVRGTKPLLSNVEVDEVLPNLVQQCLLVAERSRPSIEKVIYLVLVQSFSAVDLTDSIQRLDKDHCYSGGFAYVRKCEIHLTKIDASVQEKVSRYYQHPTVTECVDVAVKEINLANDPDILKIINRLFREIKLWLKLEHENIVPLWGVTDGFGSLPALISPWLENGSLTEYLQYKHEILFDDGKFALLVDFNISIRSQSSMET